MQPLFILAILAFMAATEIAVSRPVDDCVIRVLLSAGGCLSVVLFAVVGTIRTSRRGEFAAERSRSFSRMRSFHLAIWFTVAIGTLSGLEWTRVVRFNWNLNNAILLDELIILAPAILSLVLSWAVFYQADAAVEGQPSIQRGCWKARMNYALLLTRHHLGLVLLPVLFVALLHDLTRFLPSRFIQSGHDGIGYAIGLVLFLIFLPLAVARVWPTQPLPDGPVRARLASVAARNRFNYRDLLIWKTDDRIVNAAVLGMTGKLRFVLLSDGLLNRLNDDEVAAVFTHEIGHVRRNHLWMRMLVMVQPVIFLMLSHSLLAAAIPAADITVRLWLDEPIIQSVILLPILAIYGIVVFGFFARTMELDADAYAFQRMGDTYTAALERFVLDTGSACRRRTWLHPSLDERLAFLERMAHRPDEAEAVARRLAGYRRLFLLSSLLALALLLA